MNTATVSPANNKHGSGLFCAVLCCRHRPLRVEDMESRLKRDVLREAGRYGHHILVTEEDDDMNVSRGSMPASSKQLCGLR